MAVATGPIPQIRKGDEDSYVLVPHGPDYVSVFADGSWAVWIPDDADF